MTKAIVSDHVADGLPRTLDVHDLASQLIEVFRSNGRLEVLVPVKLEFLDDGELIGTRSHLQPVTEAGVYLDAKTEEPRFILTTGDDALQWHEHALDPHKTCPHCGESFTLILHVGGGKVQALDLLPEETEDAACQHCGADSTICHCLGETGS